jgi:hypothetical protein
VDGPISFQQLCERRALKRNEVRQQLALFSLDHLAETLQVRMAQLGAFLRDLLVQRSVWDFRRHKLLA